MRKLVIEDGDRVTATSTITFIVPQYAPVSCGVGDYMGKIVESWRASGLHNLRILVCQEKPTATNAPSDTDVEWVGKQNSKRLLASLNAQSGPIVLQYSGYGYQPRGCPMWLVEVLQSAKSADKNRKLITMFHELGASGPPWTSAFWLSPLQWRIPRSIAAICDEIVTNREAYASYLLSHARCAIHVMPVFSNVGELEVVKPLSERMRQIVVFGSRTWREKAFTKFGADLARIASAIRVTEIVNVGSASSLIPATLGKIPIRSTGWLGGQAASELLGSSLAGFFSYPVDFLAKSSIYAAYCAHGIVPIGAEKDIPAMDGLRAGEHYLLSSTLEADISDAQLQLVSTSANQWYYPHRLAKHVELYREILSKYLS